MAQRDVGQLEPASDVAAAVYDADEYLLEPEGAAIIEADRELVRKSTTVYVAERIASMLEIQAGSPHISGESERLLRSAAEVIRERDWSKDR